MDMKMAVLSLAAAGVLYFFITPLEEMGI